MINKSDIINFFDAEAEAAKKSWEATMKLSINDRVKKRKAIKDVYLDRDFHEYTEDGDKRYKLKINSNLSDFKEGDYLLLHEDGRYGGIRCVLSSFDSDGYVYVDVSIYDWVNDLEPYYDIPLVLDRNLVDLRPNVYDNFTALLPYNKEFWEELLINKKPIPLFEEDKKCQEIFEKLFSDIQFISSQSDAIIKSLFAKDYYLIQGPPGTGKSFVLAVIILIELLYFRHKVIVIGPNHMAINNALGKVFEQCPDWEDFFRNFIKVGYYYHAANYKCELDGKVHEIQNWLKIRTDVLNNSEDPWLVGATPHSLYTSKARGLKCHTLIIDEAGQMTIPLALMGIIQATKVIIAGDHKQLPPIITSDEVPDYMKESVFEALMTEANCTMLDTSFRMCEPLCEYVSDLFYDGKVKAYKHGSGNMVICSDPLYSFDKPVVIHQVDDNGMQASDKEAAFIVDTIVEFLKKGVPSNEIAVLSPFRAQAATIRRGIRKRDDISDEDKKNLVADTVDKMQGQEREVIIYSFTAGDPDYMTEMADFLYKPNKLNVAFSRAKSKLIIVGNIEKIKEVAGEEYPHIKDMLSHRNVIMV